MLDSEFGMNEKASVDCEFRSLDILDTKDGTN